MALRDEVMREKEMPLQEDGQLTKAEQQDLSIAVNLAKNLIDDGGFEVVKSAEKSRDPGQVVGQFLLQLGDQLTEKLSGKVDISPKIMLIEDGWVEQVSDYLQEEYGIPKDVMDRAEIYVGGMAQKMAESQQSGQLQGQAPQQPEAAPPTMPQQGMM